MGLAQPSLSWRVAAVPGRHHGEMGSAASGRSHGAHRMLQITGLAGFSVTPAQGLLASKLL